MLSSDTVQDYSVPEAEHKLHVDVDANKLTQRKSGEQEWQMVQYASSSLSETEKWYNKIGFEALEVKCYVNYVGSCNTQKAVTKGQPSSTGAQELRTQGNWIDKKSVTL